MPRRPRTQSPTSVFHVLNRGIRRDPIFLRTADYRAFLDILSEGLLRTPLRVVSYCLMPNHWHFVMGPVCPDVLSEFMHWVTTTHAVRLHRHRHTAGLGPVYQNRFWSRAIEEASELVRVCRYVERNALNAHLVGRAQDWPWSSLSERRGTERRLSIVSTPFLCSDTWLDFVNSPKTVQDRIDDQLTQWRPVENRPVPLPVENSALDDLADDPAVNEDPEDIVNIEAGNDQHETDAHIEGAEHLGVVNAPAALQPSEEWRHRPALAIE